MASISTTLGSTCAYFMSYTLLKGLFLKLFPKKIRSMYEKVQNNKKSLFYYCLFIWITPLFPNMLVNVASPISGIPLNTYILSTFLGLLPLNFIHVSMGSTLIEITDLGIKGSHIIMLLLLSLVALIPTWLQKREKIKSD